jgi:hypothetical protein
VFRSTNEFAGIIDNVFNRYFPVAPVLLLEFLDGVDGLFLIAVFAVSGYDSTTRNRLMKGKERKGKKRQCTP